MWGRLTGALVILGPTRVRGTVRGSRCGSPARSRGGTRLVRGRSPAITTAERELGAVANYIQAPIPGVGVRPTARWGRCVTPRISLGSERSLVKAEYTVAPGASVGHPVVFGC